MVNKYALSYKIRHTYQEKSLKSMLKRQPPAANMLLYSTDHPALISDFVRFTSFPAAPQLKSSLSAGRRIKNKATPQINIQRKPAGYTSLRIFAIRTTVLLAHIRTFVKKKTRGSHKCDHGFLFSSLFTLTSFPFRHLHLLALLECPL